MFDRVNMQPSFCQEKKNKKIDGLGNLRSMDQRAIESFFVYV